jgi:hypothetical protein
MLQIERAQIVSAFDLEMRWQVSLGVSQEYQVGFNYFYLVSFENRQLTIT